MPDIPYYDEWRNIPFVVDIASGHFKLLSLFTPDDGYTVFWFRLATWIETVFFAYDPRVPIVMGLCFITGSALILANYFRSFPGWFSAVLFAASCAMIFGLSNWENLLAAWLINSAAVSFFMLLSLTTIARPGLYWVGLVSAFFCSVSFANGLLIWPCAVLLLWMNGKRRESIPLIVLGLMFIYVFWTARQSVRLGEHHFWPAITRFFASLGIPYKMTSSAISGSTTAQDAGIALGAGVASSLVFLIIICKAALHRDNPKLRVPFVILLFGLGSCGMIAIGRSDLGIIQAISPRYYTTISLVYIGLFMIAVELAFIEVVRIAGVIVAVFTLAGALVAIRSESSYGPYRELYFQKGRDQILAYKFTPPTGPILSMPADVIQKDIQELERLHLGPFRSNR